MQLHNTTQSYGLISKLVHWIFALTVFGLFGLGLYMVDLSYYDPWYRDALTLHKSIGITLFGLLLFRLLWRIKNVTPEDLSTKKWELISAKIAHGLLYLGPLALMITGYLISTADGRAIEVFNLISIPAPMIFGLGPSFVENQEDLMGEVHEILAWLLVVLAATHAVAALKHHFMDKDNTLKRMLGKV